MTNTNIVIKIAELFATTKRLAPTVRAKQRTDKSGIIAGLKSLKDHALANLVRDNSGQDPAKVIENYLSSLESGSLAYFYRLLIEEDAPVTLSGHLGPTNPREMAVIFLRVYLWQFIKEDEQLKRKFAEAASTSSAQTD